MNKKIKQAVEKGELIPYEKIWDELSKQEQGQVLERARYLQVAISLRKLRKELRLSQEKLAEKVGMKREFIARVESGKQNITLETLYRIAEATNREFQFGFR